jgi:asparagine synthase (glutamine-hydrolysing)
MCGICGEFSFNGALADPAGLDAMRLALGHRGPDDSGTWVAGNVGFGHTRLAIIDLSPRGRQPIFSDDGRMAICFNGEIYNYQAIRKELEALGRSFSSDSDTEVAVNALAQWGLTAIGRFIGMFAIAVHDKKDGSLTLIRDRMGVKPMYYAMDSGRLLFASEPRAILAHPAYSPAVDRQSLAAYLMCGYFPGQGTILSGVKKLPQGSWLTVSTSGESRAGRYWSLDSIRRGDFKGGFDEAVEELRPLMRSAFGYRLVADVPVGMFLSGGVDSSLVASVLKKDLGVGILSFTIGFSEQSFDEADKAGSLCKRLGLPHKVRRVDAPTAQAALNTFTDIYDEPFGDPSGIPTYLVSALAREEVKVALSADGGDELFCGYTGHARYPALYRRLSALPLGARRGLAALIRAMPWQAVIPGSRTRAGQARADRLHRFLHLLGAASPADLLAVYAARGYFAAEAARLTGQPSASLPPGFLDRAGNAPETEDGLASLLMAHDAAWWMPDDILVKVDRASMHVGLECRDPLIDHRIAEFAASLPLSFLRQGGQQKRILRRILSDLGGADLAAQPKRGFEIPLSAWLAGAWRPFVEEHLSRERLAAVGLLDPGPAREVVEGFQAGRGESAQRVWLLLSLQMWAARWLPGGRA